MVYTSAESVTNVVLSSIWKSSVLIVLITGSANWASYAYVNDNQQIFEAVLEATQKLSPDISDSGKLNARFVEYLNVSALLVRQFLTVLLI